MKDPDRGILVRSVFPITAQAGQAIIFAGKSPASAFEFVRSPIVSSKRIIAGFL